MAEADAVVTIALAAGALAMRSQYQMSDEAPTGKAIETAKAVFELAAESPELTEAGRSLAKSALTIAKAVDNALLPIAAVNFGFEKARNYFNERFAKDMEEVAKAIPPDEIVEPRPSVAAPALQGLAFAHDEPNLKAMYLRLLRTAMDGRKSQSAHPGFAQIIRQFDSMDAQLFGTIVSPLMQTSIDNLERLGLISIDYEHFFTAPERYKWVEDRPEYLRLTENGKEVDIRKGILELTSFGKTFMKAVS